MKKLLIAIIIMFILAGPAAADQTTVFFFGMSDLHGDLAGTNLGWFEGIKNYPPNGVKILNVRPADTDCTGTGHDLAERAGSADS